MDFITLQNKDSEKLIKGILVYPLKVNKDESGVLVETLRIDWGSVYGPGREFAMQYLSVTPSGIARDENVWHYHPTQEDRFEVANGEIVVAVADNRDNSPTSRLLNLFHISADVPYLVLIPRQTLHSFMVVSKKPAVLLNFPTGLYNPKEEWRIPHDKAMVKTPDGAIFTWNMVRKEFSISEK